MINNNYFLLVVFLMAIGTILIRGSFIFFSGRMQISARVRELFTFIPAAIFPALIVPATYFHQGEVSWLLGKERFFVMLMAAGLCFFYRNTLAVIVFGLVLLYLIRYGVGI